MAPAETAKGSRPAGGRAKGSRGLQAQASREGAPRPGISDFFDFFQVFDFFGFFAFSKKIKKIKNFLLIFLIFFEKAKK